MTTNPPQVGDILNAAADHTPGPYTRRYTHGVGWELHAPSDLASVVPGTTIRVADAIGNERDACLFQAAPEMYAALAIVRRVLATAHISDDGATITLDGLEAIDAALSRTGPTQ